MVTHNERVTTKGALSGVCIQ